LTGKVDTEKLARYLDEGPAGMTPFESDEDPDLVEIEREHNMFAAYDPTDSTRSNQLPQIAFWQNNAKHLQEHYNFMKRDYGAFEKGSAPAQMAFTQHMDLPAQAVDRMAEIAAGQQAAGGVTPAAQPPQAPQANPGGPALSLVPGGGAAG